MLADLCGGHRQASAASGLRAIRMKSAGFQPEEEIVSDILGIGITHYPSFLPQETAPGSLRRVLKDPGLPERYRTPEGWPDLMRKEWGDDEGRAFADQHRQSVIGAIRDARAALDAFKPDFVVIWGDDQYENFREDVVPAFCLMAYDAVDVQPWMKHDRPNAWGEGKDTTFHIKGHRSGAKYLASKLIEQDFDIAYAYKPLHVPLSHAFINSVLFLDWDRRGLDVPLVPFSVNCYGRRVISARGYIESLENPIPEKALDPPSPSPARCFDLGAACARSLMDSPWRVALVASASWSHAFMTRKNSFLYPDTDADRRLFDALKAGDYDIWRSVTLSQIEESGQHEMLNWFCLAGAMSLLGRKPDLAAFFETNIMNSNKVITTFAP
jgi:hypothetical protein